MPELVQAKTASKLAVRALHQQSDSQLQLSALVPPSVVLVDPPGQRVHGVMMSLRTSEL